MLRASHKIWRTWPLTLPCQVWICTKLVIWHGRSAPTVPMAGYCQSHGCSAARLPVRHATGLSLRKTRAPGHARRLLTTTDLSLAEIAFKYGFFDQSDMTTSFTRLLGIPPQRYRQHSLS